jgi:hypothetical protein
MQRKKFAKRAFLYVGACYITWLFPTMLQIQLAFPSEMAGTMILQVTLTLTALMVPIQGTLNLLVYLLGDFQGYRKAHPDATFLCWFLVLFIELGIIEED